MNAAIERCSRWLDLADTAQVAAYERAFYQAFERAAHNRLVRWLWEWDHAERRLRTRIPYEHQRIWATYEPDGALVAAIAVNSRTEPLQAAAYGFEVPEDLRAAAAAGNVCEFLTLFINREHRMAEKVRFWRELYERLRALGFTDGLATTSPKVYPLYRWAGATLIGEKVIEGETRFFLRFNLYADPR